MFSNTIYYVLVILTIVYFKYKLLLQNLPNATFHH